jgi:signal transduction histidine kinase
VTHPEAVGSIAVIGALALGALRLLIAWRLRPSQPQWPMLAISMCGIAFCTTRLIHLDGSPDVALSMIRCQYGIGLVLPGFGMAAVELMAERRISTGTRWALLAGAILLAVCVLSPWIVDAPITAHVDALGHIHYGAQPGWLTAIVLPIAVIATFVALRRRLHALPPEMRTQRRGFLIGIVMFAACGINDSLTGAGIVSSVFVLDYAFVAFGIVAASYELRRTAIAQDRLSTLLVAKRAKLEDREQSLARTTRRLEISNRRYRHLADATREGVILCAGTRVLDVNDAACRILGATQPRALRSADLRPFVHEADRARMDLLLDATEGPFEIALLRTDETAVPVSIKSLPAPSGSHGTRVLLLRDISAERELQRRLATTDRLAAVGTLAAGTAHEINNPLTFVLANAELLEETVAQLDLPPALAAETRSLLEDVKHGGHRIRDVVKNLMSLARDRGEVVVLDVRKTLQHCIAMAKPQLRHRARVVTTFEDMALVRANEGRLFQVFLNLIVNAGHAIGEGHAGENEIRVRGRSEGAWTVIEVSDTGCGMTPAVRDRIFEPFFTTKDVGQGTGLGLSISHGIVSDLGGRIEVESTVGVGTTFRVYIPSSDGELATTTQPQRVVDAPRLRILIVDDEVALTRSLAKMLDRHEVDITNSGRDALALIARRRYDVAICDVMMPDITGIQLFHELRKAEDPITDRFLFITGGVSTPESQRFLDELGHRRWIAKPIPMTELRDRVDKLGPAPPR